MKSETTVLVKRIRAGRTPDSRTIARKAAKILALLDLEGAELSVVLCDDMFIRELNRDYRGLDKSTDVLSFTQDGEDETEGPTRMLGDVVISIDTATRQAKERRCSTVDEVTALLVHGVLHLTGFDHENAKDAQAMAERADEIESALNRRTAPRA